VVGHRGRARLAAEARDDVRVPREVRVQDLDRDAAPDPRVLGLEDDAHAALAEAAEERELAAHDHAGPQGARVELALLSRLCHARASRWGG
jgi:hypothetical protein